MVIAIINPKIISITGAYKTEEGCLSLEGTRKARRYHTISISWHDMNMKTCNCTMNDLRAQIVQHEIDHCEGILI